MKIVLLTLYMLGCTTMFWFPCHILIPSNAWALATILGIFAGLLLSSSQDIVEALKK